MLQEWDMSSNWTQQLVSRGSHWPILAQFEPQMNGGREGEGEEGRKVRKLSLLMARDSPLGSHHRDG